IENSKKLSKGDTVYAMGFPKPEKGLEYAKENVEVYEGKVEENSDTNLRFSAVISKGSTGGPLLNEEGYVVGISSPMQAEAASGCALPILEIEEILQNFSVIYGNSSWDILTDKMDMLYKECKEISEKGGYKKDSFVELQNALAVVDKLSEQENPSIEELDTAYQTLSAAKASLVPKMKKITITIYVLAGAGALLLIYFLYLLIMNHKEAKAMQDSMQKQGMQPCSLVQESDVDSYVEMKMLQLRKLRNGQVFKISKDGCIIGKSPDMADFVIEGNQAVSRKHAKISKKNNSYYLSDLDSLNGTYLNGRKVRSKEEAVLRIGDIVRIADEEFEVRY
ncbi:MAG: FHA domain-containing protein, partial [Lachnospiraceae bacterium]